jgi:hypothetical protein
MSSPWLVKNLDLIQHIGPCIPARSEDLALDPRPSQSLMKANHSVEQVTASGCDLCQIKLLRVPPIHIKRAVRAFVAGDQPINPRMAYRSIRLLLLQSLSNLLWTHAVLELGRKVMT